MIHEFSGYVRFLMPEDYYLMKVVGLVMEKVKKVGEKGMFLINKKRDTLHILSRWYYSIKIIINKHLKSCFYK